WRHCPFPGARSWHSACSRSGFSPDADGLILRIFPRAKPKVTDLMSPTLSRWTLLCLLSALILASPLLLQSAARATDSNDGVHSLRFPVATPEDGFYDAIWPRYIEVCGVTQMVSRDGKSGGPFGHATAFVKGICLDDSYYAPATRVRKCGSTSKGNLGD